MHPMQRVQQLAAAMMDDGFDWRTDGPEILEIIDLLMSFYRGMIPVHLFTQATAETLVLNQLVTLDDVFGWDAPNMTEATEDAMYAFMVKGFGGQAGRVEQHFTGNLNPPSYV